MSNHELSSDRDPLLNTNPSSIRSATFFLRPFFVIEAGANFFGGTMMLLFPAQILSFITTPHMTYPLTPSSTPSTSSIQLLQWLGGLFYALSAPLLTAARSTATLQERRASYITLASGEFALIAVMALQALAGGKGAVGAGGSVEGGFTVKSLGVGIAVLGATVVVRAWVLGWRKEWFGEEDEGRKDMRPKSRAS